ncbi:long chain fatty acyl diphosphate synthase [Cryptosporidium canis]|nr:long chain fatty acyl diphosphate synthase [Cryptosporidium canis]
MCIYIRGYVVKNKLNFLKRSLTITKNKLQREFFVDLDINSIRSEIFSSAKTLYFPPIDFISKYNLTDKFYLHKKRVSNWNDIGNKEWREILTNSIRHFRYSTNCFNTDYSQTKFITNERIAQNELIQSQLLESIPNEMKDITKYVFQSQGKRIRQHYLSSLVGLLKYTNGIHSQQLCSDHRILIHSIQLIHIASLLHDDIIDSSEIRRGKEAPHKKFDNKKAMLLGDYLFSKSCLNVSFIENINTMKCISIIAENLIKGEFSQLNKLSSFTERYNVSDDRQNLVKSYFSNYLLKSYYKTASLFSFGGIACSELFEKNYGKKLSREIVTYIYFLGLNFGLAFQLLDDILDFTNSISKVNYDKPFLSDIKHGILTIPVYFSLSTNPEKTIKILMNSNKDNLGKTEVTENIVKLLFDTYSIQASIRNISIILT